MAAVKCVLLPPRLPTPHKEHRAMPHEDEDSASEKGVFKCRPVFSIPQNATHSTNVLLTMTLKSFPRVRSICGGAGTGVPWWSGMGGSLKVFVRLNAKDNVLVGTASCLLAQEQTRGQAGRLAHHGHVVCSPRLAVFVDHSEAPAGGAVPDALLRPDRGRTENVNTADRWRRRETNRQAVDQAGSPEGVS